MEAVMRIRRNILAPAVIAAANIGSHEAGLAYPNAARQCRGWLLTEEFTRL